jgi:chromosomal replication initiation ATPase DnaA
MPVSMAPTIERSWPKSLDRRAGNDMRAWLIKQAQQADGELPNGGPAVLAIIKEVADRHLVSVSDVLNERYSEPAVAARTEASRILRAGGLSLPSIGRIFRLHHTTILHYLRREE